jgi:heptosyltransferase-1
VRSLLFLYCYSIDRERNVKNQDSSDDSNVITMTESAIDNKFRVLIIKPSSLGDIFHVYNAIDCLVRNHSNCQIDWLINPAFSDVLRYFPNIRKIIPFERNKLGNLLTFSVTFYRLLKELRSVKYDLVIDFQGLFRSAFFAWLSRSHSGVYGFANPKETIAKLFYKNKVKIPPNFIHAVDKNLSLIKQIISIDHDDCKSYQIPKPDEYLLKQAVASLLQAGINADDDICGIVVGARWPSKCFPEEIFATAIRAILSINQKIKIVLIGSCDDIAIAKSLLETIADARVISLVGKTGIGELVEIIRKCKMIVSNDSGPVHIAALLNVPVLAFFGPTDPRKTGPYGNIHQIVELELPCRYCLKRNCPDLTLNCHDLDVKFIVDKIQSFLTQGR